MEAGISAINLTELPPNILPPSILLLSILFSWELVLVASWSDLIPGPGPGEHLPSQLRLSSSSRQSEGRLVPTLPSLLYDPEHITLNLTAYIYKDTKWSYSHKSQ